MKEITREQIREILNKEMVQNSTVDKIYELLTQPEPKKFEVWKPKDGESYCHIANRESNCTTNTYWANDYFDKNAYSIGNCFKSEQEAQNHLAHLKAKKKLQDELAVMNAEANGGVELLSPNYFLLYDIDTNKLATESGWITNFPLHESYYDKYDNETTIGTLTEEEVRLAFGVFE